MVRRTGCCADLIEIIHEWGVRNGVTFSQKEAE